MTIAVTRPLEQAVSGIVDLRRIRARTVRGGSELSLDFSPRADMIHPNASETVTVRSVFVVGPDNKVKLTLTYPASTGRNFQELLRVIDSLQLTANHAG